MAIDLSKAKEARKNLNTQGPLPYVNQNTLTEQDYFRTLPTSAHLNGLAYLPVKTHWVKNAATGKRMPLIALSNFIDPKTGQPKRDPIQEEIDEAAQSDDPDIVALATDPNGISTKEDFWWPVYHLKYSGPSDDPKIEVVDKMSKVLKTGPQLCASMDDTSMSRLCMNKTADLIADYDKGYNMELSRIKKGPKNTDISYKAGLADQWVVPLVYRKNIICPYEMAKAQCKHPKYQRAIIRQYLYGEDIPVEAQKAQDDLDAKRKAEWEEIKKQRDLEAQKAVASAEKKPAKKAAVEEDDTDEEEEEAPKSKKAPAKPAKKVVKEDDEDEDDAPFERDEDDEEEEAPAPKRAIKKPVKSAPEEDEDDLDMDETDEDEDEEPAPPKKKAATQAEPAKTKKAPKSIDDELDFED